jgi:glucan biosynthesis protein C
MERVAYLDSVRILLTILVILHHVAASYGEPGVWYYNEPVSGPGSLLAFTFLMAINQAFFMGFFFFLAGYFAPHSLGRKGPKAFLRERFLRLGTPLVFYVLLINPLVCWLARGAAWEIGPGPMWFVEVLLVFTVAYVVARPFVPAISAPRIDEVSTSVLALGMAVGSFLIRIRYPVDQWLVFPTVQPAHATQYACLFVAGTWTSGSDLVERPSPGLTRYWRRAMLLASVGAVVAFVSTDVPGDGKMNLEGLIGGGTWQSFVVALWEQVVAVGLITNLLEAFGTRSDEPGPLLSSAAASTYTVYIVHPIVVVVLALALRDVPIPSLAKFLVAVPIAVLVLFASAHYVRRAPLLRAVL